MASPFHAATTLSSRAGRTRLAARGQQRLPDPGEAIRVGGIGPALQHRGAVLERAAIGDAEGLGRELAVLGAEDRAQFGGPPDVELSFFALAVGVQRRRQPAFAGPQLAQHPVARLFRHPAGQLRAGPAPQVRVDASQQGVVVEHLLEVRDHPAGVDRVPGEPAAELVVHAAAGHRLAGALGHPQRGRGPRSAGGSGAGIPAPSTAGTSARRRTLRRPRRSRGRAPAPPRPRPERNRAPASACPGGPASRSARAVAAAFSARAAATCLAWPVTPSRWLRQARETFRTSCRK